MVVFINGKPSKRDYRKFRIKSEDNLGSDYHMMKEVIYRRYYKVLMEDLRKPDLLLVDGGIQQVNAAKEILDSLNLTIPIAGMVKDDTHSTNHILNDKLEKIIIDKKSDVFHLLTRMQDEAHRFAINYHRNIRGKGIFNSILDEIEGIGPKTKEKLLKKYKSVNLIKFASIEDLTSIGINEKVALNLIEKLKDN